MRWNEGWCCISSAWHWTVDNVWKTSLNWAHPCLVLRQNPKTALCLSLHQFHYKSAQHRLNWSVFVEMCFHLLSFIQPEPLWPDACGLPRRLHDQHGQSASRGKVLGAIFKFYKQKSFTSQPLGKPKEQFHNILQYLALETSISTTFRMLEYYNANDEVEQMIRRLFRCQWKI